MMSLTTLSFALSLANTALAHGWIDTLNIAGQTYTGFNPTAAPWVPDQGTITWPAWNTDTGPVYSKNLQSPDIICSINATNAKLYSNSIAAGQTINLHWTTWPDSHHGPILSYLAACNGDCTTVKKDQLRWFKIAELGQISYGTGGGKSGVWADDQLRAADGAWSVKIPASIKAGNYVLRHEIVALHSAYDVGAAQFYPQCANIKITGNGSATPEGVVGTALYNANDPGVHYNIYNDESKPVYQMPGPKLCKCH
jgi:cellulase